MTRLEQRRQMDSEVAHYKRGVEAGIVQGRKEAQADIRQKEREANIKMADALSRMTENVARAVVTFIGEGGIRP